MSLEDDHPPRPIPKPIDADFYETKWLAVYQKRESAKFDLRKLEKLLIKYWQTQISTVPKSIRLGMADLLFPLVVANSMLLSGKPQDPTTLDLESINQRISSGQQAITGFKVLVVGGPEAPFFLALGHKAVSFDPKMEKFFSESEAPYVQKKLPYLVPRYFPPPSDFWGSVDIPQPPFDLVFSSWLFDTGSGLAPSMEEASWLYSERSRIHEDHARMLEAMNRMLKPGGIHIHNGARTIPAALEAVSGIEPIALFSYDQPQDLYFHSFGLLKQASLFVLRKSG